MKTKRTFYRQKGGNYQTRENSTSNRIKIKKMKEVPLMGNSVLFNYSIWVNLKIEADFRMFPNFKCFSILPGALT